MCRMILALGKVELKPLLDALSCMAEDKTIVHELNQENPGNWIHPDGWGIAYLNGEKWIIEKSTNAVFKDNKKQFDNIEGGTIILHARKSTGSLVVVENTHPFNNGEFVFCHNGDIKEKIEYENYFSLKGDTDSEQLFYSILTKLKNKEIVQAVKQSIETLQNDEGSNIIITSKNESIVALKKTELKRKYFQMYLGNNKETLIVSSEKIPSLNLNWQKIPFGKILCINNKTLEYSIN